MSTPHLASLPSLPPFGAAMLLRALLKQPARASAGQVDVTWRLDRIDPDHVRRYKVAFGFEGDAVPITFLYLLAQRAQLASMLARPIPFRIPGLIHVENRLAMHGPVLLDAPLAMTTVLQLPPPAPNGALHCVLETRAFDGERLAFSCDSRYLIRRGSRPGRTAPPPETPHGEALGGWTVARDAGRRYAALSGDWNPIHLWPWSARLMGMRTPIIHGAHTLAKACSLLQTASGQEIASVWCRFRQPVPLGSRITLLQRDAEGGFAAACGNRIVIEGRYDFLPADRTSPRPPSC